MIVLRSCMLFPFLPLACSLARSLVCWLSTILLRFCAIPLASSLLFHWWTLRAASINRFDDCPQHQRQHYNQTVIWPLFEPSVSIQNVPEQHVCSVSDASLNRNNIFSLSFQNIQNQIFWHTEKSRHWHTHGPRETHIPHFGECNHLFPKKRKKERNTKNRCKTVSIEIELKIACETY